MKKRIALVITQLEFGGAQKVISLLALGLEKKGYQVDCFALYDKDEFSLKFEQKYGVNFTVVAKNYKRGRGNKLSLIIPLLLFARKLFYSNYDVIQTFTHYSNIIIPLLSLLKLVRRPKIFTSQRASVVPLGRLISFVDAKVQNSLLVTKMICVSDAVYRSCIDQQKISEDKLVVISNGINLNREVTIASNEIKKMVNGKFIFTVIARLHKQKGHKYLLDALENLKEKIGDFIVLFIGDGDLKKQIQSEISEKELDFVKFLGERSDVDYILSISDCLILPSLWEGMPNVILEAMKYKLPVIATKVEGSCELVLNGKTGIIVKPASSNELAKAIEFIINNKSLSKEYGKNGFERVSLKYSLDTVVNLFASVYEDKYV